MTGSEKPVLLITGASGKIGSALCDTFRKNYLVVGLDIKRSMNADISLECDLTSAGSVKSALERIKSEQGDHIAAVIHLAAYFDFSGEKSPLYEKINAGGTRHLLQALQALKVGRFIYASTMLVHEPAAPGHKIDETAPLKPGWIYPESKARAEDVIRQEHGAIPYTILRLAGLYDEESAVPTLAHQIARIYERDFKSRLYSGDLMAGQAFIHNEDMIDLFVRVVEKRNELPGEDIMLAGEDDVMGYQELQNRIGALIYGEEEWQTITLPEFIAKPGAWLQEKAEPLIPDAIDRGEKPFIRTFMIDLASDHYDLDISKARRQLGWEPQHNIYNGLEALIRTLKKDPAGWYRRNGITPPEWMEKAAEKNQNPDRLRDEHVRDYKRQHRESLWAAFVNMGLAAWLIAAPFTLGYEARAMVISDILSGAFLLVLSFLSLSWRFGAARILSGAIGLWLLAAPLVFWAPGAAAYMNGTLTGMLVIGFAILVRPFPGISPVAAQTGPTVPPGWEFSPSSWFQRAPIIFLAVIGFFISRYLCAYQLGHIDGVWEPFFAGAPDDPKNGSEEIITSSVSEAWPVPDAGLGALTYALEILTGLIGSSQRWRTMPWLVTAFGIMIVPLGAVSIFFIIIQPIMLGTWCTLCLIAAAAMLIQIPYSLDELVATGQFLRRRKKQGYSLLRVFLFGDTDEGSEESPRNEDNFAQPPAAVIRDMLSGGVSVPWNLALLIPVGVWLMFTRLTIGAEGGMASADHLIGALLLTTVVTALAETARGLRFIVILLGICLIAMPFVYSPGALSYISCLVCGLLMIGLGIRRGPVKSRYGDWNRLIV